MVEKTSFDFFKFNIIVYSTHSPKSLGEYQFLNFEISINTIETRLNKKHKDE